MTTHTIPASAGQAELDAARLLLSRMGISPADLLSGATARPPAPTFAEYVPIVAKAVSDSSRRAYNSYWKKIVGQWGERRLDEPTPSEVKQLGEYIRANVVVRSNSRGGTSAVENFITALRCLYNQAVDDGVISEADNPASKVGKPRRLKSTRHAVPDARLAEINEVAATTGDDPALDTLLLRLHIETACRRGGGLALRPGAVAAAPTPTTNPWHRLPPASPDRYDGQEMKVLHLHPEHQRLAAHHRCFYSLHRDGARLVPSQACRPLETPDLEVRPKYRLQPDPT